jgi:flagellin-like protein
LQRAEKAVSEVIGTLLLLMIAVSLFSVLYLFVFSFETPDHSPSVSIIGYTDGYNITLEHWGGESLGLDSYFSITAAGEFKGPYSLDDPLISLYNINGSDGADDDLWSFGEKLVFNAADSGISLINKELIFRIIDFDSNLETVRGKIQDGITTTAGNNPPDLPIVIYPADGDPISNDLNPTLQVRVTDPDGNSMHVSFYNASDDNHIGTDYNVVNGGIASVVWSGLGFNSYLWYVNVTDGMDITQSNNWSFNIVDLEPPSITIIDPDGGEKWEVNETRQLNWTTKKGDEIITGIDLEYSTDNGDSWSTIVLGTPDDGQYDWNIPNIHSTNCSIQGTVHDNNSLKDVDGSNSTFTILGIVPGSPTLNPIEQVGSNQVPIADNSTSGILVLGTDTNDHIFTHSQDYDYHIINETKISGKYNSEVIYSIDITGTISPFSLNIDSYIVNNQYDISYSVDGVVYTMLGQINRTSDTNTYDIFSLSGVSYGDTINVKIKDTDNKQDSIYIDHLFIGSLTIEAGTQNNAVNWTASADDGDGYYDVVEYKINRSADGGTSWVTIHTESADNSSSYEYIDYGAGTDDPIQYHYQIIAIDIHGLEGASDIKEEPP